MGENQAKKRSGLFLCKCGTNIADFVDLDELAAWAKQKEGVAFVEFHDLLCSPAGKQFVEEKIAEKKPDTVVVAACSPKTHGKTFGDAAQKAGLNMAKLQMANIREQVGWVTKEKDEATAKAKTLVSAAIDRAALHEDLEANAMECLTDVVVIGGGIAGIEAALTAANAGRKVTIFEKDISLGGSIIKTEEVAPNMECAPCLLAPRLSRIRDNENITVVSNAEVTDVLGFLGNFTVKALKKARYVNDTCIGCEACFEVCPVSTRSSFHLGMGERKAVYTAFPGSVPATAVIDSSVCKHFVNGACDECVKACPFGSIDFDDKDATVEVQAGAVIIATGFDTPDPSHIKRLGYGVIDDVYVTPEFERLASSNGPTGGEIRLKNGQPPKSMAVIHCAASLCNGGLDYCSGVCCMNAVKAGELFRKQNSDAKIVNIHDRLVFGSPQSEAFYQHRKKEGTTFMKVNDLSSVKVEKNGAGIKVSAKGMEAIEVDMVVLSTGMMPPAGNKQMAELVNLDLDGNGFFKPDHSILHATGASLDGIYAAGACSSPCDASTAVTRAQAAAGDALARLVPGRKIELETMTTVIDEEVCAGCKLCISVCPYKAISFDKERAISVVNEAICRGCGTCAATCPSGAATAKHFTDKQIYAELGGVLNG